MRHEQAGALAFGIAVLVLAGLVLGLVTGVIVAVLV